MTKRTTTRRTKTGRRKKKTKRIRNRQSCPRQFAQVMG
jgi:hypothetical protein